LLRNVDCLSFFKRGLGHILLLIFLLTYKTDKDTGRKNGVKCSIKLAQSQYTQCQWLQQSKGIGEDSVVGQILKAQQGQ
jgi:hypothetical protein